MLKQVTLFLFTISLLSSYSQCPEGPIEFNSQAEVDAFASEWPNCTFFEDEIKINSTSEENPILNLTGLSGLEFVYQLVIWKMGSISEGEITHGSLDGLNNLDSLESFVCWASPGNRIFLESLDQIAGISGKMNRFELTRTNVETELPDFNQIDSIGDFDISECGGFTQTPEFNSLADVAYFRVGGNSGEYGALERIHIPNNLTDISYSDQPDLLPFIAINGNHYLTEISGGENLIKCGDLQLRNNFELNSISSFQYLTETLHSIVIASCRAEQVQCLNNIEKIGGHLYVEYNTSTNGLGCFSSFDILNIDIGMNSPELTVSGFVTINTDSIETINFNANLISAQHLKLRCGTATEVNGFEELQQITYEDDEVALQIVHPKFEYLPNFESLHSVIGELSIHLRNDCTLKNLTGLETLERVGSIRIDAISNSTPDFESFEGLSALDSVFGAIQIIDIPNLDEVIIPELAYLQQLSINNSPILSEIQMAEMVVIDGGNLIINDCPSLIQCDLSPTICQLASTAQFVTMSGNGTGCNDANSVLENCLLSTDDYNSQQLAVHPNPFSESVSISWEGVNQPSQLRVFNALGKVVYEADIQQSQSNKQLDLSSFPDGIYIVQVLVDEQTLNTRVVKN